jgi:hypothetical protein
MVPPREPLSPPKAASAAGATEEFDNTRARVLAALLDAHHTTFYTVISVIQATCFGFLVLVCFEEGTHFGVSQWLLAANTLVIIILVWNGFVRGFIVLSYVPKLVDGAMPLPWAPRSASRPISSCTMCAAGTGVSPPWALWVLSDM